jgi:hypothetical protein
MGFSIHYRSTKPVSAEQEDAIRAATDTLVQGRTWLSCEPVHFYAELDEDRLLGGSKPNFMPHPDDVASAAREGLPDGTLRDLLEILCTLSKDFDVDWEFSHDFEPAPIGFIRRGFCDLRLRQQLDAIADLADDLPGLMDDESTSDEDEDDDGPAILKFPSRDQ